MKIDYGKHQLEFFNNSGYLQEGETLEERIEDIIRVVRTYEHQYMEGLSEIIKEMLYKRELSPSTPQWSNLGRKKEEGSNSQALPASCNIVSVGDSIADIYGAYGEIAMLSKLGAGVGVNWINVSETGTKLGPNFYSNNKLDWVEDGVRVSQKVSQGVRRGYSVPFISIMDKSFYDIMKRADKTNPNQHDPLVGNNIGIILPPGFMEDMKTNKEAQKRFILVMQQRKMKGKIYLMDMDNSNKNTSPVYSKLNHVVDSTNICCVSGDTKILTDKGHQEIGPLEGKKVNVWNGEEYSKVLIEDTGKNRELWRVELNNGMYLDVTDNHKFYLQEGYSRDGKVVKKETLALNPGDKLIKVDLPEAIEGKNRLYEPYTQGFFTGDGTGTGTKKKLYFYKEEKRKLIPHIKARTNHSGEPYTSENGGRVTIRLPHELEEKSFVPSSSFVIRDRLEWLSGLLDSDGYFGTNKQGSGYIQVASIDLKFMRELLLMLQELGVGASIKKARGKGQRLLPKNDGSGESKLYDTKEVYRISISSYGVNTLVGLGLGTKRLKLKTTNINRKASEFIKVKSITKLEGLHDTYCFNEPKLGKGVFNGILTGQSEVLTPSYDDKTFVCVLASLNLQFWDELKTNPQKIKAAFMFLDICVSEYIRLTEGIPFMEKSRRSALEKRDLGLGTLGYHDLLQSKGLAFGDMGSRMLNKEIYKTIRGIGEEYTKEIGEKLGSPAMCKEAGMTRRNVSLMMVAPNKSTSFTAGETSMGIEPFMSNYFVHDLSAIHKIFKNPHLEKLLEEKEMNTVDVWNDISKHQGSVQHLDFLSEEEKEVFKTATEISPKDMIDLAADRQKYIDMGQSFNLFDRPGYTIQDVYDIHKYGIEKGIKTFYYYYPSGHASISRDSGESWDDCVACAD